MKSPPIKFVLFADVLGFKQLVLDNRVPFPQSLDFRDRGWGVDPPYRGNPMARGFRGFHGAIEMVIEGTAWQEAELMVFSDSLFLATAYARECMEFAVDLMRRALAEEVALRMGVAYGTFVSYGFSFQQTPFLKFISSQFFGSGVVYATETEKALRGRGMRIGIHKSAAIELKKDVACAERLLELADISAELKKDVSAERFVELVRVFAKHPLEWNYLGDIHPEGVDEAARRDNLLMHVNRMMDAAPSDDHVRGQYLATLDAVARMPVRPVTENDER